MQCVFIELNFQLPGRTYTLDRFQLVASSKVVTSHLQIHVLSWTILYYNQCIVYIFVERVMC